ncbi:Putative mitochondrial pyruvate carrier [Septoria linicola]|uniref:Mitochondrial pyruvate carrier n=1 Tax=Septoria linicola TaxID=215465 RepID=A0A9Q9B6W6_9PEZI|nr:Putative mitochondrial pyruvate carrier [Septoria linicola]
MAAMIKALNAKIRSNPTTDYLCSTHFWGPASNFGIPIAAVMDTQKDPEVISGRMTAALCGYSGVFMRYSMAVTPKNYLLFGCHLVNFCAQSTQAYRFTNWWYFGGRDASLEAKAKEGLNKAESRAEGLVGQAQAKLEQAGEKVQGLAEQAKDQVSR